MKKILVALCCVVLTTSLFAQRTSVAVSNTTGQAHFREGEVCVDSLVNLLDNNSYFNSDTSRIILYDNEDFMVLTSLETFKSVIKNWTRRPYQNNVEKLDELILEEAAKSEMTNAHKIAKDHNLSKFLNYMVAYFLDKGQCVAYCVKENTTISSIKIQTYRYSNPGALLGAYGGRRFYINNMFLFDVLDWMS